MKKFAVLDWAGDLAGVFDTEEAAVEWAREIAQDDNDEAHVYKKITTLKQEHGAIQQVDER